MRVERPLVAAFLLALPLAGCVGTPPTPVGDGCSYEWSYFGAEKRDHYPAVEIERPSELLNNTTLPGIYNVTQPHFSSSSDSSRGPHWIWTYSHEPLGAAATSGFHGLIMAMVSEATGHAHSVEVTHTWRSHTPQSGTTYSNTSDVERQLQGTFAEDLAGLTPEVERVRQALFPAVGEGPAETIDRMMLTWRREMCQ